jgi:hypothetical protein
MAKIAIGADNYKLPKFKEELDKAKVVYSISKLTKDTSVIICQSTQEIIEPICRQVEEYFRKHKSKNN